MMSNNNFVFERKKYEGKQLTPLVKQALLDRVTVCGDSTIKYQEIPVASNETVRFGFERVSELIIGQRPMALLVDLSDTDLPDAKVRRGIHLEFHKINKSVEHVAFITGKKMFFNTLLKFVLFRTDLESYSVHETLDQGRYEINNLRCAREN